jgi:hypothetical protein
MKNRLRFFILAIMIFGYPAVMHAQNTEGKSDDDQRIAIAPVIPEKHQDLPRGTQNMLLGKMRQMISLNGMSALDNGPLFILFPELMVISDEVTATTPPMRTYNMEVVFSLADRYTGNVYASASQALKGAGKTETAAYNAALKRINVRDGKYKVMLEKGKEEIISYYNTHCDLIISRGNSLASQKKYREALALLNSVPPVCRECFDKSNEAAAIIGENMPELPPEPLPEELQDGNEKVFSYNELIDLGDDVYIRYTHGKIVGMKTMLFFELINKNEEDVVFPINYVRKTFLINEKGEQKHVDVMEGGSKRSSGWMEITIIPEVNTELVCEFPKVKEVKFLSLFLKNNYFKFKNLSLTQ